MTAYNRICEWCSRDYTIERTGPGRPPPYCSESCKHQAQNALAAGRVRRMRERQQDPFSRRPRGRPRSN